MYVMSYGRSPDCLFTKVFFPESGENEEAPAYAVPQMPDDATEAQVEEAM